MVPASDLRLLCVAGEASGDRLLAPVVEHLVGDRGVYCQGAGGTHCASAGLDVRVDVSELSAHGLVEALPALPRILKAYGTLKERLRHVDAVLLVDAPELNIRLLRAAGDLGLPVAWLAPPQCWAWRSSRLQEVSRADWLGSLFPFEVEYHRGQGISTTFVGHPLAESTPLTPPGTALALLPGSRVGTVRRLLPIMLEAGAALLRRGRFSRLILGLAPTVDQKSIADLIGASTVEVEIVHDAPAALRPAGAALAGAGTVTLEAVLAGRPVVTLARLNALTAAVARRVVKTPHLALPNLILGRRAFPELFQEAVTVGAIVTGLEAIDRRAAFEAATEVRKRLTIEGPAFGARVAEAVLAMGKRDLGSWL